MILGEFENVVYVGICFVCENLMMSCIREARFIVETLPKFR